MASPDQNVVLLGSTGSIGRQTLDVIRRLNARGGSIHVVGLAAGSNVELLEEQIEAFQPRAASIGEEQDATHLRSRYPDVEILHGEEGLPALCRLPGVDCVVNALVGFLGLASTLEALRCGCRVALANKESLVVGGPLVRAEMENGSGQLLPVDSEHNAVWQCMEAGRRAEVRRAVLTASGGPFLNTSADKLDGVTPEQALDHPNWSMGSRITVDSATMVNKGFEVIEAHHLFDLPFSRIDVVVHPASTVHSLVEFDDGSILAEMAASDMRIPIQYALTYPKRADTGLPRLDLSSLASLEFVTLDPNRFPAFQTVVDAGRLGGLAPAVVNAADEVLVERFLEGEIAFPCMASGLEAVLSEFRAMDWAAADAGLSLSRLRAVDRWARDRACQL